MSELEADKVSQQEEADSQRREQEDLLVLLADQDSKLATYRRRLKELGETVSATVQLYRDESFQVFP